VRGLRDTFACPTLSGVMSLGPRAEKTGDDKDKGRKQNDERELGVDS
jgi:hypothetical protein